jgi:hypothetical protein
MTSTMADLDELVELEPEASPLRFHPGGGEFSHYGPVIYTPKGANAGNITAHELNHYWMHSSTPYGALLDELAEVTRRETMQYCAGLHQEGERIPIPAIDVARAFHEGALTVERFPLLRKLAGRQVVPWTHDVMLENWFEGRDLPSVREAKLAKLLRWLVDFEDRSREMRPDEELFGDSPLKFSDYQGRFVCYWASFLDSNEAPAFPGIGPPERVHPFGAQHLFEACAQQREVLDKTFWDGADTSIQNLYWGPFAGFVARYPGELESREEFLSVVSTFLALADLALFVPVGRIYGRLRQDTMTWRDIHPGWRFGRILDALQGDDWTAAVEGRAPRLQRDISTTLGWPPPDKFLMLGAELAPATSEVSRHGDACRMRMESEDRLIVGAEFDEERLLPLLVDHFPLLIRGSETALIGDLSERLNLLMGYSFAAFAWMVMREGDLRWHKLFPPQLSFERLFDNVDTYEEIIGLYREAAPFYPDEAFCNVSELLTGE